MSPVLIFLDIFDIKIDMPLIQKMQGIERPVDPTIVSKVVDKIYSKLHLGMKKCDKKRPNEDELRCDTFYYKNYKTMLIQKKNGKILMVTNKSFQKVSCLFTIKDRINDDSLSLAVYDTRKAKRAMSCINLCDIDNAIIKILYDGAITESMLYKNKPKMKSSQYGSQLHDIAITCIDNE